jgi:hypothetical protein
LRSMKCMQPQNAISVRVPGVYLGWANPVFLAFFAFNRINNLRIFSVAFSPIPTAPTKASVFNCLDCQTLFNRNKCFSRGHPSTQRSLAAPKDWRWHGAICKPRSRMGIPTASHSHWVGWAGALSEPPMDRGDLLAEHWQARISEQLAPPFDYA